MMVVTKDKLEAGLCRDSFYDFVRRFWAEIIPEAPSWNWHIEYICNEMQTVAERVFRNDASPYDLVINISPGTTKSTICSVMFPAWVWTRMITAKVICGSYRYQLAMDLSRKSRDVVSCEKYIKLFGDPHLRDDQNTKGYYVNDAGGGRIAIGTGGGITGFHGHFIIVDDPLDPNEAVSEVELKTANRWMNETLPSRKIDKQIAPMILIMQRLHQDDPTGHILAHRPESIRHICLPAELTENVRPRSLRRMYQDGLFDPERMPRSVLSKTRSDMMDYAYAGQFLQHPIPMGGGTFRVSEMHIENAAPRMVKVVRYWDKAGTLKGGCYTVGAKIGQDADRKFWVLGVRRGQWEAAERERIIRQTAIMDGHECVVGVEQEPSSGGKESAQNTLRNLAGYNVRLDLVRGTKETRAEPYAVQVNGGNVYVLKADWNTAYLAELAYFPFGTYKDQVDASTGAFALLIKLGRKAGAM